MGNSHLPTAKVASVTATIVYVIFGFYYLICIFRLFLLMASRNAVIFAIFVGFVNKKRGFHNFRCFVESLPLPHLHVCYFSSMGRQKFVIFVIFAVFVTTEQNIEIFSKFRG